MKFYNGLEQKFTADVVAKCQAIAPKGELHVCDKASLNQVPKKKKIVLVGENLKKSDLIHLMENEGVHHIIQGSADDIGQELWKIVTIYSSKNVDILYNKEKSSLNNIYIETSLASFEDKKKIIEQLNKKLPDKMETKLGPLIRLLSDELLTNALYNAPGIVINDKQNFKYPKNNTPSKYLIGTEHNKIKICCLDYFGSLNVVELIKRMTKVISDGYSDSINQQQSRGAGLGTSILLDQAESLTVVVEPGSATFFEIQLSSHLSNKSREEKLKSISILEI